MNSFTQLVQNVKAADWQGAGQVFKEIMQQKVSDRLDIERRTIFKEDTIPFSSDYKKYFDSMLKKWNVSSLKDIPANKKDDFFKAVDAGYEAKNEVTDDEAEGKALLDEPYPKEVDEDDDKGQWRGGALPYGRPDDPPHPEDE